MEASKEDVISALHKLSGRLVFGARRNFSLPADIATDLLHDTYIRMHKKIDAGEPIYKDGMDGLIVRTYRNLCLDQVKVFANRVFQKGTELSYGLSSKERTPFEYASLREEAEILWDGINSLPEKYRHDLVLHEVEGVKARVLSTRNVESMNAFNKRLLRAKKMLKERLSA